MRHPTENETPDAIDAELPESKTLTPGAAKPQIRNPKSERTTAEKMRAKSTDVGKKGSESWLQQILSIPAAIAILFVRCYQVVLSPMLGRTCRFHPSCSQYYILAVRKYGLCVGSWRGICRISRCHPWNPGGYDPP